MLEKLKTAIEQAGYEPREYSGRFMYGNTCIGFAVDNILVGSTRVCAKDNSLLSLFEFANYDELGKGYIIYFPRIGWE